MNKIDLSGQTILISGGAGDIGEAITGCFLEAGACVVVPSRNTQKLEHLQALHPKTDRLLTIAEDIGTSEGAKQIANEIKGWSSSLNGVIASLGGWYAQGKLPDFELDTWQRIVQGGLTAHFNTAKTFLPLLLENTQAFYTFVNGGAALMPVPQSGPVSIVAAAQLMMKDVLANEYQDSSVRINTLLLNALIATRARPHSQVTGLTADEVAKYLLYLASDRALDVRGKTVHFAKSSDLPE